MASFSLQGGTAQVAALMPRRVWAAAAAAALTAIALTLGAIPGDAATAAATPLCRNGQHANLAGGYTVVNGEFNATSECVQAGGSGFTVTRSPGTAYSRHVRAYPYIFRGCSWSVCSPAKWLPARVSTLTRPVTTVRISGTRASGVWNAAYDIWLASAPIHYGQANRAEVMVWLDNRGLSYVGQPQVTIDRAQWYKMAWRVCRGTPRVCWNYVSFRRVRGVTAASGLALGPFLNAAGVWKSWYLLNVEFGFEVWSGGQGLGVSSFRVTP